MAQSYSNSAGSGQRRYLILVKSQNITWNSSGSRALVDTGIITWPNNGTAASGATITFDFGSSRVITESTWNQSNGTGQGTWQWYGSNDDSSYSSIGSSFSLATSSATVCTQLSGNSTAYRYYRLTGVSGSMASNPDVSGLTFKIDDITASIPDYGNAEGTGDRTATMTVTQSQTSSHGDILFGRAGVNDPILSLFVDNLNRADVSGTGALEFKLGANAVASKWIRYQFSDYRIITEVRWFQDTTDTNGVWQLQGSNDGTTFTNIGSTATLGGSYDGAYGYSIFNTSSANTTAYLYYRLLGSSGSGSLNPLIFEAAFKIALGTAPATGSLFRVSPLSGLGTGGPFFTDPLG